MDGRKELLCSQKICRFCLAQNDSLLTMYDGSKAPKNVVPLSVKILYCVGIETFPSDKMPRFICNRCKFFMDLCYGFKQICRQADERILQFIENGSSLDSVYWSPLLIKVFRTNGKTAEVGMVETVVQSGETVKVMAEEVSESEEDDDDDVYNVKIGDGPEEGKRIKVVSSDSGKRNRKDSDFGVATVNHGCWACDECERTYPLEQLLDLHKTQKHRSKDVECDECNAKFYSKYDLYTHQQTHSDEMPFQCVACNRKFKRLVLLKRHEKTIHAEMPQLPCPYCPASFISTDELLTHQQKHLKYVDGPFPCHTCDKTFNDKMLLSRHLFNEHVKNQPFSCYYCPEQFTNVQRLSRHLKAHAGERPYPCKHCDKSFMKSHHYTRHLRVKHREVNASAFRCDQCDASFASQDELMFHSALHATANLVCPLCQEKFDDVDTVTAHIKSHVNGTEFMCDYCELIFTTKEKLESHMVKCHDEEINEEYEADSMDMDAEDDDEDNSLNVTEEDGHMVVEIKKADDYMLPASESAEDEESKHEMNAQSEDSEMDDSMSAKVDTEPEVTLPVKSPPKPAPPPAECPPAAVAEKVQEITLNRDPVGSAALVSKQADTSDKQISQILKKAEEVKIKVAQQTAVAQTQVNTDKEEKQAEKKEKPNNNNKAVTSTTTSGASEKSLRLLEKELQELKRTSRPEIKTPSKPLEALRNKRPQIHTSTPKTRNAEKKEVQPPKSNVEKNQVQEKRVLERRAVTKENKEPKEIKETKVVAKDAEDKSVKEDEVKETKKDAKEKEPAKTVVKNGASEKPNLEESVRRSTRPSKIKDYAKMIRDSSSAEDSDEENEDEDDTKEDKSIKQRGRTTRRKQATETPSPASTGPKKRGRPRKDKAPVVPAKMKKDDSSDDEAKTKPEVATEKPPKTYTTNTQTAKPKEDSPPRDESKLEQLKPTTEPNANILVSPSGQTLKRVPIKSLPPGVKPLPLPRTMGAGEVCEMQIGKKVVKVQKIVMTKAEVEAMAKKGLVEMKDGTMVLKQGIKLPTAQSALSTEADKKQESPKKD